MEIFFLLVGLAFLAAPVLAIWALVRTSGLDRRVRELEREALSFQRAAAPRAEPAGPVPEPPAPIPPVVQPPPRVAPPVPPIPAPATPRADIDPWISGAPPRAAGPPAPASPGVGKTDLEYRIGVRWFNVAGIVTLLFGVAFFLKYAYDNAWIGPKGRVAIGIAAGLLSIILGERTRRRGHRVVSEGLAGGGIAALYLSFFFSFRLYQLIEIAPAFVLMAAVTACGVALALLQNSLAVAILAFTGAYLTPILLSTGQDAAEFLFGYLAVIALGALGATYFKKWRALDILAFAGTCLLYSGWHARFYRTERLGVAITGLAIFYFIFLLIPYGYNLARRATARTGDHVLALANAVYTFGYLYRMINPVSPKALGFIAVALSACYLALGSAARRRVPEDRKLAISILGLAIAFLALAVPLEFGLHGITLAWAVQGLVILWLGFRYEARLTRLAGLAIIGLAVVRLFVIHVPLHTQPFTLFWNPTFGTWLAVATVSLGAAWLARRRLAVLTADETWLPSCVLVAGALLILISINLEVREYFSLWSLSEDRFMGVMMLLWSVVPLGFRAAGRYLDDRALGNTGFLLLPISVVHFLYLTGRVGASSDLLFGSFVFWMGMAGIGSFVAAAEWCRRVEPDLRLAAVAPNRMLIGMATALLLLLLTVETYTHFKLAQGTPEQMQSNTLRALLAVSVLWALFASGLMAIGFARSNTAARYSAASLFTLTLLKVFLMDTTELRAIYRIISFVCLGLLLVVASLAYSRFRSRIAIFITCAALGLAASTDLQAALESSRWQYQREIQTASLGLTGEGFGWAILDDEILASARPDLADLRIIGRDGVEIPYVVWQQPGGIRQESFSPHLLNRGVGPGGAAIVELDFGAKTLKNRLLVRTAGADFRRRVMVEGSDGSGSWVGLTSEAWIYRIPNTTLAGKSFDEVPLPEGDHRRLRVTVFPMTGEKDAVDITGVEAYRRKVIAPQTAPLRVASFKQEEDPNSARTVIEIDFGYRSARPLTVDLEFGEQAFRRPYTLFERNEMTTLTERGRTERQEAIVARIETPWRQIASGLLFRLPPGRTGEAPIDETSVTLAGQPARYVRFVIQNQDDRPLKLTGVSATGLVERIVFPVRPAVAYTLLFGNPEADQPTYDLPALLPDLETHTPVSASLGAVRQNPEWRAGPPPPFFERHGWLLWVVLLAAVGLLLLVVMRNARGLSQQESDRKGG
ncbi:MAG TPA: DUF2339 domain-containing protein [Candidatus Polarisedimenticolia bacterium]|nr:DUF2339 domain-containing protein [Candidatus Polarisedimenticolia bacterium]